MLAARKTGLLPGQGKDAAAAVFVADEAGMDSGTADERVASIHGLVSF